ncbi:CBS-domain-containing protein [Hesseltinella vesiculosa]|uniref:CBS-domain-containing protein n=1 Tax=Hesseltinella vesiculosa TaxID=101127 RepID=A0A1X2GAK3_9FUNG|nr:CBS-domain-containing protein [Hesseltinella vesiculosa]
MTHREGVTTVSHDWTLIKASSLIDDQVIIEIDGNTPVEQACHHLVKNNISSAPVFNMSTSPHGNTVKKYCGMFDAGDVIAYILLVLKSSSVNDTGSLEIQEIVQRAMNGKQVPVSLASDLSQRNPFYSIMHETTLLSAVEIFACGTHRVCVLKPDGTIKGILSQSTVVKYLYEHRRQFPEIDDLLNRTVRQLSLGESAVISVNADSPVLEALSQMSEHGVSSVAVLGHMGVILGNISMTDVKYVLKSVHHRLLWETCIQFVSLIRTQQGIEDGQDRLPVFDVRLETTLGFAIAKLLATRAHRVWVTDERDRPIGVLSLTDIMVAVAGQVGVTPTGTRRSSVSRPAFAI